MFILPHHNDLSIGRYWEYQYNFRPDAYKIIVDDFTRGQLNHVFMNRAPFIVQRNVRFQYLPFFDILHVLILTQRDLAETGLKIALSL